MSFDSVTEAAARRLASRPTRRTALGLFAGAAAALGLGLSDRPGQASAASGTLTLVNQTGQTIWPGVAGNFVPNGGGFELPADGSTTLGVPANWSGRIWARTSCNFGASGTGGCETGDCGGVLACNGAGGAASATLAEFTLGGGSAPDYYDVSLVDAFNVPITITPQGGAGCATAGCSANLDPGCPSELQVVDSGGNIVACLSSCSKFGGDQYCCTGSFDSSSECNPASWPVNSANYFKSACPDAYSYAVDPVTSNFSCQGASGYVITFLPFGGGAGQSPAAPAPAPLPPPVITQMAPPTTTAGMSVTLTGQDFGSSQESSYLTLAQGGTSWGAPFDWAKLTITSWNDTSITFTLPPSIGPFPLQPGTATITVTAGGQASTAESITIMS